MPPRPARGVADRWRPQEALWEPGAALVPGPIGAFCGAARGRAERPSLAPKKGGAGESPIRIPPLAVRPPEDAHRLRAEGVGWVAGVFTRHWAAWPASGPS